MPRPDGVGGGPRPVFLLLFLKIGFGVLVSVAWMNGCTYIYVHIRRNLCALVAEQETKIAERQSGPRHSMCQHNCATCLIMEWERQGVWVRVGVLASTVSPTYTYISTYRRTTARSPRVAPDPK